MNKGSLFAYILVPLLAAAAIAAEAPSADDLIGRWSGEPPMGGKIEINVTSIAGGKIAGTARIPNRNGAEIPMLSGDVKGKRVTLETKFSGRGTTVVYRCELTNKDELPCTTGGKKTTFTKVHS